MMMMNKTLLHIFIQRKRRETITARFEDVD